MKRFIDNFSLAVGAVAALVMIFIFVTACFVSGSGWRETKREIGEHFDRTFLQGLGRAVMAFGAFVGVWVLICELL